MSISLFTTPEVANKCYYWLGILRNEMLEFFTHETPESRATLFLISHMLSIYIILYLFFSLRTERKNVKFWEQLYRDEVAVSEYYEKYKYLYKSLKKTHKFIKNSEHNKVARDIADVISDLFLDLDKNENMINRLIEIAKKMNINLLIREEKMNDELFRERPGRKRSASDFHEKKEKRTRTQSELPSGGLERSSSPTGRFLKNVPSKNLPTRVQPKRRVAPVKFHFSDDEIDEGEGKKEVAEDPTYRA
jgi:hypothetical protein